MWMYQRRFSNYFKRMDVRNIGEVIDVTNELTKKKINKKEFIPKMVERKTKRKMNIKR